jgi:protein-L-isoaspartate(D-aspartate) O-methyltransferase
MDYQELMDFAKHLDRGLFLDAEIRDLADLDEPLPIGFGQTISQPSLVWEMTFLLSPEKDSKVLEIGTGSGYQTALLAQFSKEVYTVERIPELGQKARKRLQAMGYTNVFYRIGDGSLGWPEHGPYDRIIVTAAAEDVPKELMEQLAPGGVMIIPVGPPSVQELQMISKDAKGKAHSRTIEKVRFVELIGKYGWSSHPWKG